MVSRVHIASLVGLCLLLGIAGCSALPAEFPPSSSDTAPDIPAETYPPGTGPDGIAMLSVVNAHNDVIANRSYTSNVTITRRFPDETRTITLTAKQAYEPTPGQTRYALEVRKYTGTPIPGTQTSYREHYRGPVDGIPVMFGRGSGSYGNHTVVVPGYDASAFETQFLATALGNRNGQFTPTAVTTQNGHRAIVFEATGLANSSATLEGRVVITTQGRVAAANVTYAHPTANRSVQVNWSTTLTEPPVSQPSWTDTVANTDNRWNISATAVNESYIAVTNHDNRSVTRPIGLAYVQKYDPRSAEDDGVGILTGSLNQSLAPNETIYAVPTGSTVTVTQDPPANTSLTGQISTVKVPVNTDRGSVLLYGPVSRTQTANETMLSNDTIYAITPVESNRTTAR